MCRLTLNGMKTDMEQKKHSISIEKVNLIMMVAALIVSVLLIPAA